jgi:hypothetical protein
MDTNNNNKKCENIRQIDNSDFFGDGTTEYIEPLVYDSKTDTYYIQYHKQQEIKHLEKNENIQIVNEPKKNNKKSKTKKKNNKYNNEYDKYDEYYDDTYDHYYK